jgi:hypothetical protein
MNIITVTYKRTYPLTSFAPESIGLEATIDGTTESPIETYLKLKELADQMHEMSIKSLPEQVSEGNEQLAPIVDRVNNRLTQVINDIKNCNVVDEKNSFGVQVGLLAFQDAASKNDKILEAYLARMAYLKTQ